MKKIKYFYEQSSFNKKHTRGRREGGGCQRGRGCIYMHGRPPATFVGLMCLNEDDLTKACTTTQKRNEHVSHGILQFTSMAKWINITAPDLPEIRAQISLTATDTSMWCELDISQAASTLIILCCEKIETQARKPESYLCGCFVCRHPFGAVDMRP